MKLAEVVEGLKRFYPDSPHEVENASVGKVTLGDSDRGSLTAVLMMDLADGCTQGFGTYYLGKLDGGNLTRERSYGWGFCAEFIARCLKCCGKSEWGDLPGSPVRVLSVNGLLLALGHYLKDEWFCPRVEWEDFK